MKLLLSDAIDRIAPECLPASSADQVSWINAVCAQFLSTGKWEGTTLQWRGSATAVRFAVYEDAYGGLQFTLPRNLLCLLASAHGDDSGGTDESRVRFGSRPIRGMWHEFGNGGYGVGDTVESSGAHDAGDGFAVFRDFAEDSYLRVKTDVAEATGATVRFRGLDEDGEEIYSGSGASTYQGIDLDISTALTTTTAQVFSAPPTLVVKPVTRAQIRLYSVSVADGTETLIGVYDPGETAPSYRRYRISGNATVTTVHAIAKRRHVDAVADQDEVVPGNVQAIEYGLMGRRYDLANDPKTAAEYWSRAFGLLNASLGEAQGSTTPNVQFAGPRIGSFGSIH